MAAHFISDAPQLLLNAFDARISQAEPKGKITTWVASKDGQYYTHRAAEWSRKAWFKPSVITDRLIFYIVKPQNLDISSVAYAYYHGHLIETFLSHFDTMFSSAGASSMPEQGDRIQ